MTSPETNIVMLDIDAPGVKATDVLEALAARGVWMVSFGPARLRAVTHLDVDDAGVGVALEALADAMSRLYG